VSAIRFYFDEDCQSASLISALRQRGLMVEAANEAALRTADDDVHLAHAARSGAVLVSNNIRDFVVLHRRWLADGREHAGLVLFPQQTLGIGAILRGLLRLQDELTAEEMHGRLEWLNDWAAMPPEDQ
jgi:hypothetical protein